MKLVKPYTKATIKSFRNMPVKPVRVPDPYNLGQWRTL